MRVDAVSVKQETKLFDPSCFNVFPEINPRGIFMGGKIYGCQESMFTTYPYG